MPYRTFAQTAERLKNEAHLLSLDASSKLYAADTVRGPSLTDGDLLLAAEACEATASMLRQLYERLEQYRADQRDVRLLQAAE